MTRPCVNVGWNNSGKLLDMFPDNVSTDGGGCVCVNKISCVIYY